jgi:hypothetical protein
VQCHQRSTRADRVEERRVACDGPAQHRSENDSENHVEGGASPHEALLAELDQDNGRHVDDERPDDHLNQIEIVLPDTDQAGGC